MSLQIETRHDERSVLLRCDTCEITRSIRTLSEQFPADVESFFIEHADCSHTVELTG